jgi:hypothetical protein
MYPESSKGKKGRHTFLLSILMKPLTTGIEEPLSLNKTIILEQLEQNISHQKTFDKTLETY